MAKTSDQELIVPTFKEWFCTGSGNGPGYRHVVSRMLVLDGVIGLLLACTVNLDLPAVSSIIVLPLVGILIGLVFAWAGNVQSILQETELELLSKSYPGGFVEFVYSYQLTILVLLGTLVAWGLAALGPGTDLLKVFSAWFMPEWVRTSVRVTNVLIASTYFALSSLALRECWGVAKSAGTLLIARIEIRKALRAAEQRENQDKGGNG